jgi:hypothetical protein
LCNVLEGFRRTLIYLVKDHAVFIRRRLELPVLRLGLLPLLRRQP